MGTHRFIDESSGSLGLMLGGRFSLVKHPKIIEACRVRQIAVEVCPISYVMSYFVLGPCSGFFPPPRNEVLV